MPRYQEAEAMTPFAQVLTDYMWNRRPANRPPMTTSILAVKLGIPRQTLNAWIYRGTVPSIEDILLVLARLDLPLRALYDAYKRAGLSVPRFDTTDPERPIIQQQKPTSQRRQTRVPVPTNATDDDLPAADEVATGNANNAGGDTVGGDSAAPAPRPYVTPPPLDHATEAAAEWDRIIAQTAAALRAEGLPEESIEAAVASLRTRQSGGPTPTERHIAAEHRTEHHTDPHEELREQPTQLTQPTSKTSAARRSDSRSKNPAK